MSDSPFRLAELSLLLLVPATFIAVCGYFAWPGGHALNLCYFLPTIPFMSILACYVWREIAEKVSSRDGNSSYPFHSPGPPVAVKSRAIN